MQWWGLAVAECITMIFIPADVSVILSHQLPMKYGFTDYFPVACLISLLRGCSFSSTHHLSKEELDDMSIIMGVFFVFLYWVFSVIWRLNETGGYYND